VNASAHQLRHFAGSAWYRASGYDLLVTSRLLRHVSVATTQIYAALDEARLAEVVGLVNVSMGRRPDLYRAAQERQRGATVAALPDVGRSS
jgi:hypothetical protein